MLLHKSVCVCVMWTCAHTCAWPRVATGLPPRDSGHAAPALPAPAPRLSRGSLLSTRLSCHPLLSPNDALGTVGRCGDFRRNRGRTGEKPEGVALVNGAGLVTVVLEWGQRGPEHGRAGRLQGRSLGNGDPGQPGGPLPHGQGHAARAAGEHRGNGLRPDSQAAVAFPGCFADPGAAVHAHACYARFWGSRPGLRATPTDSH